jgi:precorrin-3B methylase
VATLEKAVAFYTSDTFNNSPSGQIDRAFVLNGTEVNAIAALLRALNALENIRSSNAYVEQAFEQELERARETIRLSIAETTDAIAVLAGGPLRLFALSGDRQN